MRRIRSCVKTLAYACLVTGLLLAITLPEAQGKDRPHNVLLICVDDLNTHLGCYGDQIVQSPNIDRLARQGRQFNRHYVPIAACGPSRCSMLTGRTEFQSWDVFKKLRMQKEEPKQAISLPHLFHQNGYRTICIGKVSHNPGGVIDDQQQVHEVPFSWDKAYADVGPWKTPWGAFCSFEHGNFYNRTVAAGGLNQQTSRLPYERSEAGDDEMPDARNAAAAIRELKELARSDQPFFLAVGFYRPHLPFTAPAKFWNLYDSKTIGQAAHRTLPVEVDPALANHKSYELTHYHWPWGLGNIPDEQALQLRHGYHACVSYTDTQIGKVLDACSTLGLDDNTTVALWSDHGFHLGDKGMFGKRTDYEAALRSPLVIRTPKLEQPGTPTDTIVNSIDLYPTLADLCGLTVPATVQGRSLLPQLADPQAKGLGMAIGTNGRAATIRTDRWRLTLWKDKEGEVLLTELYDHENDPEETENVAKANPDVVGNLTETLKQRLTGT